MNFRKICITGITCGIVAACVLYFSIKTKATGSKYIVRADCTSQTGLAKVVCLAEAFKATLSNTQLELMQLEYSKATVTKWSNFPQAATNPKRPGVSTGSLNAAQLTALKALMNAVLAQNVVNEGYDEVEGGWAADDYLAGVTGKSNIFGAGNFYIAFLGKPSTTGLWELQYGGHHYAFADTYNGGKVTGVTPSFRGVEPMFVIKANNRTYQPVEQERQAFADMIASLGSTERTSAKLSATFSDVLLGPGVDNQFPATKQGLKVGGLNAAQKTLVLNTIKLYVNDLDTATAASFLAQYKNGLDDTFISFSGSGTMSQQTDYVRIDGPSLWIEYSVQGSRDIQGTTHPHSVWRDRNSDYGGN